MISIVMASYLGNYATAASRRAEKLVRAVDSVIRQTSEDWELIVVADGCEETVKIMDRYDDKRIRVTKIEKAQMWSGVPRNTGIKMAKGEYVCYLDNDDAFGPGHIAKMESQLKGEWIYFNDWIFSGGEWMIRPVDVKKRGLCGTSNVCHKSCYALWNSVGYAHDYHFIQSLMRATPDYHRAGTMEYFVMHIPGGYDL
jgi:glycosyltransferase involved in cell wall biosynthesis